MKSKSSRQFSPLSLEQFGLLRLTIAEMPRTPNLTWQAYRDLAILQFVCALGTRAKETSAYRLSDICTSSWEVRQTIPIGHLQAGTQKRHPWNWVDLSPELRQALQDWITAYKAEMGGDLKPYYPLWLSWKHKTVVHGLKRESLFRPIKTAGRICGIDWVNLEVLRNTTAYLEALRLVTPEELDTAVRVIEIVNRFMRQHYLGATIDMLRRRQEDI